MRRLKIHLNQVSFSVFRDTSIDLSIITKLTEQLRDRQLLSIIIEADAQSNIASPASLQALKSLNKRNLVILRITIIKHCWLEPGHPRLSITETFQVWLHLRDCLTKDLELSLGSGELDEDRDEWSITFRPQK